MYVGIVILNYNTADDVIKAIDSIKTHVNYNYHVYLVDNCSKGECIKKLKAAYDNDLIVTLIISEENKGYSGGNNIGIKQAIADGCDAILILNPDVEFQNDIVSIMVTEFTDSVVCVAPKVFDLNGNDGQRIRPEYNFKYAFFNKKPLYYIRRLFKGDNYYKYDVNEKFVFEGFPSGCCFLMRSDAFEKVGFFDDNVFLYSEELILANKLTKLQMKCCYAPEAIVKHNEGTSTRKISTAFVDYHMYASEYYLLKKYCDISKMQLRIIKILRLVNFKIKSIIRKDDKSKYLKLKKQMKNIDEGAYKIDF